MPAFPYFAENAVLAQQKLEQIGECKQDEVVFAELAERMNLSSGKESLDEIFNKRLAEGGSDLSFADLKEKGAIHNAMTYHKYKKNGGFNTASGKIELYSLALEKLGYEPLPYYAEPPESPISTPEVSEEFPLVLTSGARLISFFTSEHRQIKRLRKVHPDPIVDINPETAAALGIEEGDWIWIETKRGKIKQKAKLFDGIDKRVINVEFGWWFPEKKDGEYGIWDSNANVLTNNEGPYDPAMGTYQLRALLCKVYK